jgi:hypothetical protein
MWTVNDDSGTCSPLSNHLSSALDTRDKRQTVKLTKAHPSVIIIIIINQDLRLLSVSTYLSLSTDVNIWCFVIETIEFITKAVIII